MRFDRLVTRIGDRLPLSVCARIFAAAVGQARVALCMHRIGIHGGPPGQPHVTCRPETLDALIRALLASRPSAAEPWLTVSFDDGYLDAVDYVRSRAREFPTVEWLLFVCPEKAEKGAGYRWDVPGAPPGWAKDAMDPATENRRAELLAAGRHDGSRVATVSEVRDVLATDDASAGNHTNAHALQVRLSREQAAGEYSRSTADFERLFGPQRHFAFPFGTPHHEVTREHLELLWRRGEFHVWTTERRPYTREERTAGAPLPRFSPDGRWGAGGIALWIAAHALLWRTGLRPGAFDPTFVRGRAAADAPAAATSTTAASAGARS